MPSSKPFRVGRSRTGLGLFATAPIKKGAFIIEYKGRKLNNAQADAIDNKYLFEINSRWTIDGSGRRNTARYINHSCRPNAESDVKGHRVIIRAIRNIEPGTEISYDYGKDYFKAFLAPIGCRCPKCTEKRKAERAEARAAAKRRKARKLRAAAKAQAPVPVPKAPAKAPAKAAAPKASVKANGHGKSNGKSANGSKRSANGHASTRTTRGRAASGGAMARRNVAAASRERTLSL